MIANDQTDMDSKEISLADGLKAADACLDLFFDNLFTESKESGAAYASDSMYHALGIAFSSTITAMFTMEKEKISEATQHCNHAMELIQRHRKKSNMLDSLTGMFTTKDYNEYSEIEAHAEICCAEMNVASMILNFLGDQSLTGMIKVVKMFFSSNSSYKLVDEIRKHKNNWSSDFIKNRFETGVYLGYGFVNLIFSHLPARVTRIMSVVGISADGDLGLAYLGNLIKSDSVKDDFRVPCGQLGFLLYSFYIEQFFGLGYANFPLLNMAINKTSTNYPKSFFSLFFAGRLKQIKGHTNEAIELFEMSIDAQSEMTSLHNVSRWDMLWAYAIDCKWSKAADCAKILQRDCVWSPATNAYQYACFMFMIMDEEQRPELRAEVDKAMSSVIELRRRYVGKTLPPEKFAVVMAQRYLDGEQEIILPALVLFYIWNIFGNCAERPEALTPLLERIQSKKKLIKSGDNYHILNLLEGVCLRNMKCLEMAGNCFVEILRDQEDIEVDTYLPPQAALELGLTFMDLEKYEDAKTWLIKARDAYTGFLVESMVHLRIHGALEKIRKMGIK